MSREYKGLRKVFRKVREPAEWFLIGLAIFIIPKLSMRSALRLAHWVAVIVYIFDSKGKAVSAANLKVMCKHITPKREAILIHGAYDNMARVLLMIFWFSKDMRKKIDQWIIFPENVKQKVRDNIPCITVSAHIGNWEILSQACVNAGIPMTSVAKQIGTPAMTKRLTEIRSSIGQEIAPADGALRFLMRAIRDKKCIGLLIDQYTHTWNGGAWINFFGLPTESAMTPVALALKLKTPIFFAWSRPLKDGHYKIEPGKIFYPEPNLTAQELTQKITTEFEQIIRRHPTFWCINYRRWRYIKKDFPHPEKYPYYARPERPRPTHKA